MRLERHDAQRRIQTFGNGAGAVDDRPVAQMHPVEIADGGHATVMTGAQVMQTADQLHV